jgi:hypothetical protein
MCVYEHEKRERKRERVCACVCVHVTTQVSCGPVQVVVGLALCLCVWSGLRRLTSATGFYMERRITKGKLHVCMYMCCVCKRYVCMCTSVVFALRVMQSRDTRCAYLHAHGQWEWEQIYPHIYLTTCMWEKPTLLCADLPNPLGPLEWAESEWRTRGEREESEARIPPWWLGQRHAAQRNI